MDTNQSQQTGLQPTKSISFWEQNRTLIKGIVISFLILLMLIPTAILNNLVNERAQRKQEVIREVSSKWADPQTILGPILAVPYTQSTVQKDGKVITQKNLAYFLPSQLNINSDLKTETRHRSIFDVTLYSSDLIMEGSFDVLNFDALNINKINVHYNEAKLLVGLNDLRGLDDEVSVDWNGQSFVMESLNQTYDFIESGLNSKVALQADRPVSFQIKMKLKGSEQLYFTPVGKVTNVQMKSTWQHPAFDGMYLPTNSADISEKGFSAKWKVLQASRPYPQQWLAGNSVRLNETAFGVKLIQPTDSYTKTERSVKYALLFISLTFGVFFVSEIIQKKQIHPLQYLLVGIALLIFYSLLLSISEYIGFNKAYAIAVLATVSLIGWYVFMLFRKVAVALGFGAAITALYGYIFFLIQMQDYALLFGSIGLFVVLAIAMYATRKIDWYNTNKRTNHAKLA